MVSPNQPKGVFRTLLNAVTSTSTSTAYDCEIADITIIISGITTATVVFEVSNDGTNYVSGGSVTADGLIRIAGPFKKARARVSAYTSGTITAVALM